MIEICLCALEQHDQSQILLKKLLCESSFCYQVGNWEGFKFSDSTVGINKWRLVKY